MLASVNSGDIPLYFLFETPFGRREIAVDLNMEKIFPRLRLLVPGLRNPKQQTGIRLKTDCFPCQRDVNFPLQLPFSVHAGKPYGRNTFRQKPRSYQDVCDSYCMLEKIGIAAFVR